MLTSMLIGFFLRALKVNKYAYLWNLRWKPISTRTFWNLCLNLVGRSSHSSKTSLIKSFVSISQQSVKTVSTLWLYAQTHTRIRISRLQEKRVLFCAIESISRVLLELFNREQRIQATVGHDSFDPSIVDVSIRSYRLSIRKLLARRNVPLCHWQFISRNTHYSR